MAAPATDMNVTISSGDGLDIRQLAIHQGMSQLFSIQITAVSSNPNIDFQSVIGQPASVTLQGIDGASRTWTGIANELRQLRVEEKGVSTYRLRIVPTLWLLTQRRNHRIFQQLSELDIVVQLLAEWNIEPVRRITGTYKKRKYKVEYAESDFAFMSRMLEDIGVSFYFEEQAGETKLVLSDAPQSSAARQPPIPFLDAPTRDGEHVTGLQVGRQIRPGKLTLRDHDYRKPHDYPLMASATSPGNVDVESKLEGFYYVPGEFLFESDKAGGETPSADDRGKHRTDEADGATLAQRRLDASRADATSASFISNAIDLAPGTVMTVLDHPHDAVSAGQPLLVVESEIQASREGFPRNRVTVVSAKNAYHPPMETPTPTTNGVESATVVGPPGEEIHVDEFGRVRVQFHWDRVGRYDADSSCWIHVSQPWGGAGYGGTSLPRVGQEVIVDFLGGDPDRPVIVGRVYTNLQKTPYSLPAQKTQSGWRSNSSPTNGGYNELMFDDAAGDELLRIQAQKDLHKVVKNDEMHAVGRDRTRKVVRDEDVSIGNNRSKTVSKTEKVFIGQNHALSVGGNRSTQVGQIDSTMVGGTYSLMISPPGEGIWPASSTSHVMKDDSITFTTPGGASIKIEGASIHISAGAGGAVVIEGPLIKSDASGGAAPAAGGSAPSSGSEPPKSPA